MAVLHAINLKIAVIYDGWPANEVWLDNGSMRSSQQRTLCSSSGQYITPSIIWQDRAWKVAYWAYLTILLLWRSICSILLECVLWRFTGLWQTTNKCEGLTSSQGWISSLFAICSRYVKDEKCFRISQTVILCTAPLMTY